MQLPAPAPRLPLLSYRPRGWLWSVLIGAGVAAAGLGVRALIGLAVPDIYPFPLIFPAVLGATLLAGWRAGVVCLVVSEGLSWRLFLSPIEPDKGFGEATLVTLALSAICAVAMILIVERRRRAVDGLQAFQRHAAEERERVLRESQAALAESEARLRIAAEAAQVGVWDWRIDSGEVIYSPEARQICGFSPDEPITIDRLERITHADDLPWTSAQVARALDPALRDTAPYEYRIVRPDGEVRWVTASGRAFFEARDGEVVATRYQGAIIDITERQRAAQAVRASEQRLRLALSAARMAVWQADRSDGLTTSPEVNRMLGLAPGSALNLADLAPHLLPGEAARIQAAAAQARERGEPFFEIEFRYRLPSGEVRWFGVRSEVIVDVDGGPGGAIGVVMDVTDRKSAEERVQLLAREVDHRANNLMAVIQATISLSSAETADELRDIVIGRLHALSRTTHLLAGGNWVGADLRRLVEQELAGFGFGADPRIQIDGPPIVLAPEAAQAMAMSLHELATNAVKHGALGAPEGRVEARWRQADGRLRLTWTEQGGPRVTPPQRKGFGATLLARALGGALGGSTELDWRADGLVCELQLPLGGSGPPTAASAEAE